MNNFFFTDSGSSGISLSLFLRSLYSKLALLCLSSIGCSYGISLLDVCRSKVIKAHCMYNFSERMQFPSDRSLQAILENEEQLFVKSLPSIVICLRPINVNCTLSHWVRWVDKQSNPEYCVNSPNSGSLPLIHLSLTEIEVCLGFIAYQTL